MEDIKYGKRENDILDLTKALISVVENNNKYNKEKDIRNNEALRFIIIALSISFLLFTFITCNATTDYLKDAPVTQQQIMNGVDKK